MFLYELESTSWNHESLRIGYHLSLSSIEIIYFWGTLGENVFQESGLIDDAHRGAEDHRTRHPNDQNDTPMMFWDKVSLWPFEVWIQDARAHLHNLQGVSTQVWILTPYLFLTYMEQSQNPSMW